MRRFAYPLFFFKGIIVLNLFDLALTISANK